MSKKEIQLNALKSVLRVIEHEQFTAADYEIIKIQVGNKEYIEVDLFDFIDQFQTALNDDVPLVFKSLDDYITDAIHDSVLDDTLDLKVEIEDLKEELNQFKNPGDYESFEV